MHRSESCACCKEYATYLVERGVTEAALRNPRQLGSCHASLVEGYFVEGHVPIEAIEELLERRPAIDGITLPGMPPGSPGMGGERQGPWEALAVVDGEAEPFGTYSHQALCERRR